MRKSTGINFIRHFQANWHFLFMLWQPHIHTTHNANEMNFFEQSMPGASEDILRSDAYCIGHNFYSKCFHCCCKATVECRSKTIISEETERFVCRAINHSYYKKQRSCTLVTLKYTSIHFITSMACIYILPQISWDFNWAATKIKGSWNDER